MSFLIASLMAGSVFSEEGKADEAVAEMSPELKAEIAYVEALIDARYPDFAGPVLAEIKKRWPDAGAQVFALDVRALLSLGKFDEAEKMIASLPDRKSTKFWAARLEMANSYFSRGKVDECMAIYKEFFEVFPKPPKDIFEFYLNAAYAYGQLLVKAGRMEEATQAYEHALQNIKTKNADWCNMAVETAEIYLRLADSAKDDPAKKAALDRYASAANKLADSLLWFQQLPVIYGRAVSMKAHIVHLKGKVERAAEIIDEYMGELKAIHEQILEVDPEGKFGLLRSSPLPECRYLQAKMRWDEAQKLAKEKGKARDDKRIKDLLFGPKDGGKRDGSKGAFNIAVSIFLNYETSAWAPAAGELSEEIKAFAEKEYGAKIKTNITPEQIAKVRAAQFKAANELYADGDYKKAAEAYLQVLAKFPEYPESIAAVENVVRCYLDRIVESEDEKEKADLRLNADTVEGYLVDRFGEAKNRVMMSEAGNAVLRLAATEQERKEFARADELYTQFLLNYRNHTTAPNFAAGKAAEMQADKRYEDAIKYWNILATCYTNSPKYAAALSQLSTCWGKLGDKEKEISYMNEYLKVEELQIRRLQAQFRLAQMYQRDGLDILGNAATNEVEGVTNAVEVAAIVETQEKRGTAQIIRAIKQFQGFRAAADAAIKDPNTASEDIGKYKELREAAMFMVGECWCRMNRPEKNLKLYRERAAKCYEEYVSEYPNGNWTKYGLVRLGTIYTALGDVVKSKEALALLSQKFPDSDEAKNAKPRLAKSLIEMGMKREGTEIYGEMLRTDGAYTAQQFLNAGDALIDAKSWDMANQAYEKAVRIAGTNSQHTVAKARLGQARCQWKQGSLAEARESLDLFLNDTKMARTVLAADAHFMLVAIASQQGRTEKDATMRTKYFGTAIASLKKVRSYWKAANKPLWEQDTLDLLSADVLVDRMKSEEAMGLKEDAAESCGRAAGNFQMFINMKGPTEEVPFEKMEAGARQNLERAYESAVPLFAKRKDLADLAVKYGEQYLNLFPNGKGRMTVINAMNQAKADMPSPAPTTPVNDAN